MDSSTGYPQSAQPPVPPTPPPGYQPPVPPTPPPGYEPVQQAAPYAQTAPASSVPPKKKRKGCLIAAIIAAVLLLGCIGTVIAVAAFTSNDGATAYSEADFDSAVAKIGVTWPELPEGADPADYERVYTGQKAVDVTLTEAELSALMSYNHDASYWPISNMSVQLLGGNSASASMDVTYMGRSWPVEVSGSGAAEGSGLGISLASASVMGVEVPAEYLPMGSDFLEQVINPRMARAGISIQSFEVTGDGVRFVGTTWESAEYVPK